jgi:hypothetical protein
MLVSPGKPESLLSPQRQRVITAGGKKSSVNGTVKKTQDVNQELHSNPSTLITSLVTLI